MAAAEGVQQAVAQPLAQQPVAQQPVAVRPAVVRERPVPTAGEISADPVARPGDLVCQRCSWPNPPSRQYCRRCGLVLHVAAEVRLRWWQRWWRRFVAWLRRNRNEYPDTEPADPEEDGTESADGAAGAAGAAAGAAPAGAPIAALG
ncbi:MAG: hypothetical protein ACRDY0_13395, partial [Acidimicrobiales bacterium]